LYYITLLALIPCTYGPWSASSEFPMELASHLRWHMDGAGSSSVC